MQCVDSYPNRNQGFIERVLKKKQNKTKQKTKQTKAKTNQNKTKNTIACKFVQLQFFFQTLALCPTPPQFLRNFPTKI